MTTLPRLLVVVPRGGRRRVVSGFEVLVVREEDLTKCHSPDDVAAVRGAQFVTLSPVAPTISKPGYGPALGVKGVREAVAMVGNLPIFALGGVTLANARSFLDAGAYGVAVMGPVSRAEDPAGVVASYLAVIR